MPEPDALADRPGPASPPMPAADEAVREAASLNWHCGPLPDPDDLAAYEALAPGTAKALIKSAYDALCRRDALSAMRLQYAARHDMAELVLTFLLAILAGAGGFDSLNQGDLATGLTLSGGSLSAMALALLRRRQKPH